jgi:hypothetical protein
VVIIFGGASKLEIILSLSLSVLDDWRRQIADRQKMIATKDSEIAELKEQVRDLMFYLEAGRQVASSNLKEEELRDAKIEIGSSSSHGSTATSNRNKKR